MKCRIIPPFLKQSLMPKIFISYGRDESYGQNLATEAQKQLQATGFDVFRDVIGLKPGDVWYNKLEHELETSDLVLLIVSEKIRKSPWVYNEVNMAQEIGLPIIPVIAERIRMPLWLRHLQALDFSDQECWSELVSVVREYSFLPDKTETKKQSKTEKEFISVTANSDHVEEIDFESAFVESPKPDTNDNEAIRAPLGPFRIDFDMADSSDEKAMQSVLMRARKASWDNRFDEAADLYATLIDLEPNVIGHKGELGNVFWRQGFPEKAAEQYAGIAVPMIINGNDEPVTEMVGFIGLFYPDSATEIRKLLETVQ